MRTARTVLAALVVLPLCLPGCTLAPRAPSGAGATTPPPPSTGRPNPQTVPADFFPLPVPSNVHVFYAVLAHSNGKVYVGTCYHIANLVEFDPASKEMKIVARMTSQAINGGGPDMKDPTLLGDLGTGQFPMTRWVHGQDKIHAQLHEGADGRVYGATHVKVESADSTRTYPGGHWFAYDPKTGKTEDLGWARRHEGIITCCMDKTRNALYGVTWPTGYLVRCRPGEADYVRRLNILGLISSHLDCSTRYFDVVRDGRVYVPDGATGNIRIYDPDEDKLHEVLGLSTPAADAQSDADTLRRTPKWRNWWFTGTRSPDGMHIFLTSQRGGRLTEIDATQGKWGVVIDHGRLVPWAKDNWGGPVCGIMAFATLGRDPPLLFHTVGAQLLSYDPSTGRVLDWGHTVLRSHPSAALHLDGGGSVGKDGRIYCIATHDEQSGVAVLDPRELQRLTPQFLRQSPRRIIPPQPTEKRDFRGTKPSAKASIH